MMTLGVGWEWGTEPTALAPTEVWEVLTGSTWEWREGSLRFVPGFETRTLYLLSL